MPWPLSLEVTWEHHEPSVNVNDHLKTTHNDTRQQPAETIDRQQQFPFELREFVKHKQQPTRDRSFEKNEWRVIMFWFVNLNKILQTHLPTPLCDSLWMSSGHWCTLYCQLKIWQILLTFDTLTVVTYFCWLKLNNVHFWTLDCIVGNLYFGHDFDFDISGHRFSNNVHIILDVHVIFDFLVSLRLLFVDKFCFAWSITWLLDTTW